MALDIALKIYIPEKLIADKKVIVWCCRIKGIH